MPTPTNPLTFPPPMATSPPARYQPTCPSTHSPVRPHARPPAKRTEALVTRAPHGTPLGAHKPLGPTRRTCNHPLPPTRATAVIPPGRRKGRQACCVGVGGGGEHHPASRAQRGRLDRRRRRRRRRPRRRGGRLRSWRRYHGKRLPRAGLNGGGGGGDGTPPTQGGRCDATSDVGRGGSAGGEREAKRGRPRRHRAKRGGGKEGERGGGRKEELWVEAMAAAARATQPSQRKSERRAATQAEIHDDSQVVWKSCTWICPRAVHASLVVTG